MSPIVTDLRLALGRLAASPGLTALAVATLALGLGAHSAIFGLVDAAFLRPLPLPEPDRLAGIYETRDGAGLHPLSYPDFLDYRERSRAFSELAAHYPGAPLSLRIGDQIGEINGSVVSSGYFPLLGVEPARGRFFTADEDRTPDAHPVAVASYRLWQTRLGGRDDAIGTEIELNGRPFTVVGVAPEGFEGVRLGTPSEVWIPTAMARVGYRWCDPLDRDCTFLLMIGRLAPGAGRAAAQAEMEALARGVRAEHPSERAGSLGLAVAPLTGFSSERRWLLPLVGPLLAAVTLVLLVAGANLTGLLVARGLVRRREIAIRVALGAPRRRVVALFVAEAALLALAGAVAGLAVARGLAPMVAAWVPTPVPLELGLAPATLVWTAVLAAVTALAVGLVAGLSAARPNLSPALGDRGAGGGRRGSRLLGGLVVAQVALSMVLLVSAGLLVRSLLGARRIAPAETGGVATVRLRPRLVGYPPARAEVVRDRFLDRLRALPGVRSASLGVYLPPGLPAGRVRVRRPGAAPGEGELTVAGNQVGPRFFDTFGIRLLRGRDFDRGDVAGAPLVAIVDRTLADRLWPGGEAVGRRLVIDDRGFEVVGVVEDAAAPHALRERGGHQVYRAYGQDPTLVDARIGVRTAGDAAKLLPALRREIHAVDPAVPATEVETLDTRLRRFLAPVHLTARVAGAAGALALLLSAAGLYGVLALAIGRRAGEIGIRTALGASRAQVMRTILRDVAILVAIALALGLAGALVVGRALERYLYGVSPRDPATFAMALAVVVGIAALAAGWPAWRAARADPLAALRRA